MEFIKKKILLENFISRNSDSTYGSLTATSVFIKFFLTQTIDDIGIFSNIDVSDEVITPPLTNTINILHKKLKDNGILFPFMTGATPSFSQISDDTDLRIANKALNDYLKNGDTVTGITDSKLNTVKSYDESTPFKVNFDFSDETYTNFKDITIDAFTGVLDLSGPTGYTIDANPNKIGKTGILYNDLDQERTVFHEETNIFLTIPVTTIEFVGEGWNKTNASLSAITKEEMLMGIIFPPEVENNLFIDRGETSIMESHLKLSEIETLEHLFKYGAGFFNLK